jgi:SAM-dependent methyltransferase
VDCRPSAIDVARRLGRDLSCAFEVSRIPSIPPGPFDVVMLLETILAFPDKQPLLRDISGALSPGGRFAFTLEEGEPLTEAEQAAMPDSDTVWLTPLPDMLAELEQAGLLVRWQQDWSRAHHTTADSLGDAFTREAHEIAAQIGQEAMEDLLSAHRLWSAWLGEGRVRKIALVTEKT